MNQAVVQFHWGEKSEVVPAPVPRAGAWNGSANAQIPARDLLATAKMLSQAVLLIGIGPGATLLGRAIGLQGWSVFWVLLPFVVAVQLYGRFVSKVESKKPKPGLAPWEKTEGDRHRYEVEMDIVQGNIITGSDRGILFSENGVLCFAGSSTSFALTADMIDWLEVRARDNPARPFERRVEVGLKYHHGVPYWRVQFDPLGPETWRTWKEVRRLVESTTARNVHAELSQYPPAEPGPGSMTRAETGRMLAFNAARYVLLVVVPLAVGFVYFKSWLPILIAPELFVHFSSWRGLRQSFTAYRQLGARGPHGV
jgi:hypothetical protein